MAILLSPPELGIAQGILTQLALAQPRIMWLSIETRVLSPAENSCGSILFKRVPTFSPDRIAEVTQDESNSKQASIPTGSAIHREGA